MPDRRGAKPAPEGGSGEDAARVQRNLMRIAHMFGEYRDDRLMREMCRLAIKFAQEGLIGG